MPAARISSGSLPGEREHDVDIVNHQIQHHVHVQAARAEFAQPVHFEEQGLGDHRLERGHRRIESLQMPDLQNASGARGGLDQHAGFVGGARDRFFDQDIHTELHQPAADLGVRVGGCCDHRARRLSAASSSSDVSTGHPGVLPSALASAASARGWCPERRPARHARTDESRASGFGRSCRLRPPRHAVWNGVDAKISRLAQRPTTLIEDSSPSLASFSPASRPCAPVVRGSDEARYPACAREP